MIAETLLALVVAAPADDAMKCGRTHTLPGYPENAAVLVVDGEIRGAIVDSPPDDLDASDILRLEIQCWNPVTDELPASQGVQVIAVVTKSGRAQAEAATFHAADLLQAFISEQGELPSSLEDLDASLVGYALDSTDLGWTLTSSDRSGFSCSLAETAVASGNATCQFAWPAIKERLRSEWGRENRLPN